MNATPATTALRQLLVATDGSENGDRAVAFALAVALRHRSDLLLCYALDRVGALAECSATNGGLDLALLVQSLEDGANAILTKAAQRATDMELSVTTVVLDGPAAQAIVACAHEREVDAIVIGTQGKRGIQRLVLGSTADDVLRRADVPVFVVPPSAATDANFGRILAAIDDSDPSDAAASLAIELAKADDARLIFCSVAETSDLLEKAVRYDYDPAPMRAELRAPVAALLATHADRARSKGVPCENVIVEGHPAQAILKTAAVQNVGLIIVGTHGRRGMRRLFLGSVAERVIRDSPVPVAVVRALGSQPDRIAATAHATHAVR